MAGVAGRVAPALGVKNIEENAFRPLVAKRERVRFIAAARLKIGVMAGGGAATCGVKKRLGVGCRKRELLKARVWAGLVRPVSW